MLRQGGIRMTSGVAAPGAEKPAPNRLDEAAMSAPRLRALLVASDASVRKWGSRWLELAGLEATVISQFEPAPGPILPLDAEVAVVDACLPEVERLNLCQTLRGGNLELPLILICAGDKEAHRALDAGVTDVVIKPVDWRAVSRRAAYMAAAFRSQRELERTRSLLEQTRQQIEQDRTRQAAQDTRDQLTGLPNRHAFEQALEKALASAARSGGAVAVILLDLDRFKLLNESFGRYGGDAILQQVGQLLNTRLLSSDFIARHHVGLVTASVARRSGDEFILMLTHVDGRGEVAQLTQSLFEMLSHPFSVNDTETYISASAGIAIFPEDGKDADSLLLHAELALCDSKRRGGGAFRFYKDSKVSEKDRHLELDRLLRRSLERGELQLHYQPLVEFSSGAIVGAEALLRWNHPLLGQVSPREFIPVAELSGLMVPIGSWVLRSACRQLRAWLDQGLPPLRMAVNIALCQLQRGDLPAVVREVLQETELPPGLLELELSERGTLRGDPEILEQLIELKQIGVRLSVDDFGTGHSAIAYLKRFPLDTLKIDQSYVHDLDHDQEDAAIASAIVAMAQRLHLAVVAEGVELKGQFDVLNRCGCNEFQGFLFAPGLEADAFRNLVNQHRAGRRNTPRGEDASAPASAEACDEPSPAA